MAIRFICILNKTIISRIISIIVINLVVIIPVDASTSFIAAGHLQGITDDKDALNKLAVKFESLDPDYIFILGDSSLHNPDTYNYFNSRFKDKIYFSPGNHDIVNGALDQYINNVGYTYKTIEDRNIRFILINSLDNYININKYLESVVISNPNKLQIILTHHRLWDDTLTSGFPLQHDKSYYFKEIYPSISSGVKAIFAGNSKRQYFTDYNKMRGCSLQNVNNIYWADQVGEITGYSVGAGDCKPKLGFVYVENTNGKLIIEPHHINFEKSELIPIEKIRPVSTSIEPGKSDPLDSVVSQNVKQFFQKARKRTLFILGALIGSVFSFLILFMIFKVSPLQRNTRNDSKKI